MREVVRNRPHTSEQRKESGLAVFEREADRRRRRRWTGAEDGGILLEERVNQWRPIVDDSTLDHLDLERSIAYWPSRCGSPVSQRSNSARSPRLTASRISFMTNVCHGESN